VATRGAQRLIRHVLDRWGERHCWTAFGASLPVFGGVGPWGWLPTVGSPLGKRLFGPFKSFLKVDDMVGELMDGSGHVSECFCGRLLRGTQVLGD